MRVSTLDFHNIFPRKWQDEYSPIDFFSHAPKSGQASQTQCKPISNDGEDRKVEVLRMVAECFSKYDCLNFDGHEIETTFKHTIHSTNIKNSCILKVFFWFPTSGGYLF
jgi:hypothetical protein